MLQKSPLASTQATPVYGLSSEKWHNFLFSQQKPNQELRAWLMDKSSLTAKLIALSGGDFYVQVLSQTKARAHLHEVRALGIKRQEICLVREVILRGNQQAWVYARSLLPLSSLTGSLRRLRKQGAKPLGAFLFSQPHLKRGLIQICHFGRHQKYVPKEWQGASGIWGRRSIFFLDEKPLLVSEVFLENFPAMKKI